MKSLVHPYLDHCIKTSPSKGHLYARGSTAQNDKNRPKSHFLYEERLRATGQTLLQIRYDRADLKDTSNILK